MKASWSLLLTLTYQAFGVITVGSMDDGVKSVLDYRCHIEFQNNQ